MRTVAVELIARVEGFKAGITTARGALKELGTEIGDAGQKHPKSFKKITDAAGIAGLGLMAGFGFAVKSAMDFDKQMSVVLGATGANSAGMDRLRDAAIRAGAATKFSATEAAQAEAELGKAGISTGDILSGALTGSLSLAAAGDIDLADAATIAAQAMNAFGLQGKDVGHIADVLAAGANKSAADVTDLAAALRQAGGIASNTGLSLEDTVGTLSAFADNAMVGSDAGTSLKTMLQALANPSKESAKLMEDLGISAYDTSGNFVGITNLAGQLQTKLGGLTQAERDHAMAQIFGSDASRAAIVLYKLGSAGIEDYIKSVNDVGAAEDMAHTKMDNLSGDIENLTGSLETLTVKGGSGVSDSLRGVAQAVTRVTNAVGNLPEGVTTAGMAIVGITGLALTLGSGLLKGREKVREFSEALADLGPMGKKGAAGLEFVARGVAAVTIALTAAQVASAAFGHDIDPSVRRTAKELDTLATSGKVTGDTMAHLDYDLGTLGSGGMAKFGNGVSGVAESLTGLGSVADESLYHAKQRIDAIDQGLAALVSGGHTNEAQAAFDRLAESARNQGVSLDDLKRGLPQYQAALDGTSDSADKAAGTTDKATGATGELGDATNDAAKKVDELKGAFDSLNGVMLGMLDAKIAAEKALDDLSDSIKKNGNNWDINTEAGRNNVKSMADVISTSEKVRENTLQQTGSIEQANAAYQSYLQRALDAAGGNQKLRGEIQNLINTYGGIPPEKITKVEAPGLVEANNTASGYKRQMDSFDGRVVTTTFKTQFISSGAPAVQLQSQYNQQVPAEARKYSNLLPKRWGGITEYAATGLLRDANVYAAGTSPLYGFAEPETHGEAFIPKNGNMERSRSIAEQVVGGWLGGQVSWNRTPVGGNAHAQQPQAKIEESHYHLHGTSSELIGLLEANQAARQVRQRAGRPQ